MRIVNSPFYQNVLETQHLTIGDFYFFENVLVSEVKEGVHLDVKNSQTLLKIINAFYKERPFGHIANRINKYSISPIDFANFSKNMCKVESFCAIIHNNRFDEMNVEIEKRFLQKPYHITYNLQDAFGWTTNLIDNYLTISA